MSRNVYCQNKTAYKQTAILYKRELWIKDTIIIWNRRFFRGHLVWYQCRKDMCAKIYYGSVSRMFEHKFSFHQIKPRLYQWTFLKYTNFNLPIHTQLRQIDSQISRINLRFFVLNEPKNVRSDLNQANMEADIPACNRLFRSLPLFSEIYGSRRCPW